MVDENPDEFESQAYAFAGKCVTNWSKTFSCTPELYFEPEFEKHFQQILKLARNQGKLVHVMGCGQSPSDLPFTDGYLISVKKFDKVIEVNKELAQIKVQSGVTLQKLNNDILPKHDLALPVVGAVSTISLSGAISTGTHNSGVNFGTMASYVVELEVMTADGGKIKCNRKENSDLFLSVCCGLGAMGIILTITYQCERAFKLKQNTYAGKLKETLDTLDVHLKSSDHFRFYWFPHTDNVLLDHISRTNDEITKKSSSEKFWDYFWNYLIGYFFLEFVLWLCTFSPAWIPKVNKSFFKWIHCKPKTRVDRGDKVLNIECLFSQYVTEWSIPIDNTAVALYQLKEWLGKNPNIYAHFPVEVRFVKKEDYFLSPTHGRDSCYINIIAYRPYGKHVAHERYWAAYEEIMQNAEGRPHWAKAHHVTAQEFRKMYPKFEQWCTLRQKYDPTGMFKNAYLERILL